MHADGDRNPSAAQYLATRCCIPPLKITHRELMPHGKQLALSQSSALLARLKSAESAIERGQTDDARLEVMNILAERPQSETALQLAFNLSAQPGGCAGAAGPFA